MTGLDFDAGGRAVSGESQQIPEGSRQMLGVDLFDAAGRAAYLAGFHAAQALIFEHLGKVFKGHSGFTRNFYGSPRMILASSVKCGRSCRARTILKRSPTMRQVRDPKIRLSELRKPLQAANSL
jgi:hypothetical protein